MDMAKIESRESLEKKLAKVSKIADRKPIEETNLFDVIDDSVYFPYGLALGTFAMTIEDSFDTEIKPVTENGRVRGKAEMGALKTLDVIQKGCSCFVGGFAGLIVAAIETPLAVPVFIGDLIKTAANNGHNKRIEKARRKRDILTNQLAELDTERTMK